MKYITGDILKTLVRNPFVYHYGIVIIKDGQIKVAHNQARKKNSYGGSVLVESLQDFLKTRTIIHVQRTNIKRERIIKIIDKYKTTPFNALTFNCEQFVSEIRDGSPSSPQVRQWFFNIVTLTFIVIALWKRKATAKDAFFHIVSLKPGRL